jgi:hypothetical protein
MTTAQNIVDFLNAYNPTGAALAPDRAKGVSTAIVFATTAMG